MNLEISDERSKLDVALIHQFLHDDAYWCQGIPRSVVERAIENSLCFGAYVDGAQVGFARLVTDYATFAYLCDVFVLPAHRGRGVSKALMQAVIAHPRLQDLRRMVLGTKDAHGLYAQYGFAPFKFPERFMERLDADVYKRMSNA